jgi:hypothetical protein
MPLPSNPQTFFLGGTFGLSVFATLYLTGHPSRRARLRVETPSATGCASRLDGQYCSLSENWHCRQLSPQAERLRILDIDLFVGGRRPHYYFDVKDGHWPAGSASLQLALG